jgi:hypothetical protein
MEDSKESQLEAFRSAMRAIGATIIEREWAVEIQIDEHNCFLKGYLYQYDPTTLVSHSLDYAKIDVARTVVTRDLTTAQRMFDDAVQTLWRLHGLITIGAPPAKP